MAGEKRSRLIAQQRRLVSWGRTYYTKARLGEARNAFERFLILIPRMPGPKQSRADKLETRVSPPLLSKLIAKPSPWRSRIPSQRHLM